MVLNDYIKQANDVLALPIDFGSTYTNDENYKQLYRCATLILNTLTNKSEWAGNDTVSVPNISPATILYGILAEYAFVAGMFNEWKVWKKQYGDLLFKQASKTETKIMPKSW